jgi:hypothetical protein
MTPTLHSADVNWPLVQKLLAIPMYKRMYIAHMRTILSENFANGSYFTTAQSLQSLIGTSVNTDVNKFFTYTQFTNNLTTDVASGMTSAPGLSNLMNARNTWLNTQSDFTATPPNISGITPSNANPAINSTVTITANVANTNNTGVYLGHRYSIYDPFKRIQMYDDGAHNDGSAGDGVYGVSVPVNSSYLHYYIYAENSTAGMFSPQRAEYEYYTLYATVSTLNAGELALNEIMPTNSNTAQDQNGEYDDWIELYNNTSNYISLKNVFLSDSYTNPLKWQFPDNTTIAPSSFLIIWADKDTTQSGLHTNFKLSGTGEKLILSYASGLLLDSLTFGTQASDVSYQRCPNGVGAFTASGPSYNLINCITGINEDSNENSLSLFPVPANSVLNIESDVQFKNVMIYDVLGAVISEYAQAPARKLSINISSLQSGIYFIRIDNGQAQKLIVQH